MKIHILGIGGTFMAGIAIIAKQLGHQVTGSDKNLYDPMKSVLEKENIVFTEGYNPKILDKKFDLVIVGNVMSRGMSIIEKLLESDIKYISGPQWLYENVLYKKKVIAISGTHGKTTTSSLVTWILKYAKLNPSYLIGGQPINLNTPAKLTNSKFFIIEADEYDTSFFDKRSKYIHYHPNILVINNIEFDHADIFENIDSVIKNFHHLIRIVPKNGKIIYNHDDKNIRKLIQKGVWSKEISMTSKNYGNANWSLSRKENNFFFSNIKTKSRNSKIIKSNLMGIHNYKNISLAILASMQAGVSLSVCIDAIKHFKGVKRRMEKVKSKGVLEIYDDFAHHPTEIESSVKSLKENFKGKKILSICEIKSHSMISGAHKKDLPASLNQSHYSIIIKPPLLKWTLSSTSKNLYIVDSYAKAIEFIKKIENKIDIILIMSNKSTVNIRDYIENEKNK
jgi:UDP-N-acetylmuramate: L-alanyl-gamma-D-glutamyl-meso-diaminopimelate ligase|tara:strand:+ start:509 stop:1861 length:1353 start_codon:yes stop_codon:yes gene_type:complete